MEVWTSFSFSSPSDEIGIDHAARDKYSLAEIQKAVKEDPKLQDLTEDEEQEYVDMLLEKQAVVKTGTQSGNKATALDATNIMDKVEDEVS